MKFSQLKVEEFKSFIEKHPQTSFTQRAEMLDSLKSRGMDSLLLGVKENEEVIAGAIVVLNSLKLGLKTASINFGPILDYSNDKLVKFFIENIEKELKKKKVVTLTISPNIEVISYDDDFNPTPLNNSQKVINIFNDLGYQYKGQEISVININWIMTKDLKDFESSEDLFESYNKKTKNRARKAEENNIRIIELDYDELDRFYNIEEHTSETREFDARKLSYFQSIYKAFKENDGVRAVVAQVNLKELRAQSQQRFQSAKDEVESIKELIQENDTPRNQKKLNAAMDVYNSAEKQLKQLDELSSKYDSDWVDAATRFYVNTPYEVVCIAGGALLDLDFLQPTVAIYTDTFKWAYEKGFDRYNYFGVYTEQDKVGETSPILHFKKGFGGEIINLIGSFEKVISPTLNKMYSTLKKVVK